MKLRPPARLAGSTAAGKLPAVDRSRGPGRLFASRNQFGRVDTREAGGYPWGVSTELASELPETAVSAAPAAALKQTPLHAAHVKLGGKMVGFGGWSMPVQYPAGILAEHRAVRTAAGVFDISHMGQLVAGGPGAKAWLNTLFTNDLGRIGAGKSQYGFFLNEAGGVIDDLIIYEYAAGEFLLVVNASKIAEDFAWLETHLVPGIQLSDRSERFAALAVQGPRSAEIFSAFFGSEAACPERFGVAVLEHDGLPFFIARTGYTGEDGFEWFFPARASEVIWNELLAKGAKFGLIPCGLGARDSLRLEVCYPLNGLDLSPQRTPLEAGLGIFVDLNKPEFIGRDALLQLKAQGGPAEKLVAFRMTEKCPPPRPHYPVYSADGGQRLGETTSGGLSPTLDAGIGLAYVPVAHARAGETIQIDIRGRRFRAVIEKKPLYKKPEVRVTPVSESLYPAAGSPA
jgi:aminomethyltransferase